MSDVLSDFQADLLDEVLYGDHRVVMLPGSRYGGKTFGSLLAMIVHGQQYVKPRMLLGGTSYDDIRANCTEGIEYWAEHLGLPLRWPRGATEFSVGSQVWEVRGLLHEQGARRVKGRGYKGAYIDELSEIEPTNWHMVYTSVRGPGVKIVASWNPKGPRHFTELMARDPAPFNGVVLHSTMLDNTFADQSSVAAFQNRDAFPDYQYQRLVLGLPAAPEGQVYPHYDVTDFHAPGQPCVAGVDYGESGVTAAMYFQRNGEVLDANRRRVPRWSIVDEYYYDGHKQGKRNSNEHTSAILQAAPGPITRAYIDPSAVDLRDAMRRKNIPAINADNDAHGYDITNGALQRGVLTINIERCPALTTEIEDLVYNALMEKPDPKCVDHATDAMRYGEVGVSQLTGATFETVRFV